MIQGKNKIDNYVFYIPCSDKKIKLNKLYAEDI